MKHLKLYLIGHLKTETRSIHVHDRPTHKLHKSLTTSKKGDPNFLTSIDSIYSYLHSLETTWLDSAISLIACLRQLEKIKLLGVILDKELIWNEICKSIGILCNCKKYFNENTLIALCYSFVYPHLCYCIEVLGNASKVHMSVLIKLQKTILRIIASKRSREHCAPLFSKFKIFHIEQIYMFFVILLV